MSDNKNDMKDIIVLGDRVLISPDESEEKTAVGLYLPQTVKDHDTVMRGFIVKTGPGIPLADTAALGEEPWHKNNTPAPRYFPMEAHIGDYVLFLHKAAVEIKYENQKYFVVSQNALLLLVRDQETDLLDSTELPPLDFE